MITDNLKGTIEMMKEWNLETLKAYKYIMFVIIGVSLIGIYWYLKMTRLGTALIFVSILCLAGILALERRLYQKMDEEQTEKKEDESKEEKKEVKEEKNEDDFQFGLPTPESCKEALEG